MIISRDLEGIYVRIGYPDCDVKWLDGHGVIALAYEEERRTGDTISDHLLEESNVINLHRQMYDEYGVYLGRKEIRSITVLEAVRYLGRFLRICRFLTLKEEAERFVKLLETGGDKEELRTARMVRALIPRLPSRVSHKLVPNWHTAKSSELVFTK